MAWGESVIEELAISAEACKFVSLHLFVRASVRVKRVRGSFPIYASSFCARGRAQSSTHFGVGHAPMTSYAEALRMSALARAVGTAALAFEVCIDRVMLEWRIPEFGINRRWKRRLLLGEFGSDRCSKRRSRLR